MPKFDEVSRSQPGAVYLVAQKANATMQCIKEQENSQLSLS